MSGSGSNSGPDRRIEHLSPPLPQGREKQRSRTGCRTCRSRKVKCDETPGGCKNCERLNLPCPNSASYHSAALRHSSQASSSEGALLGTQAGLRRSRTYRSCRPCRTSKSRCSGERPTCIRCRQRGLNCSYDGRQAPAWAEAVSADLERRTSDSLGEGRQSLTPNSVPSLPTDSSGGDHSSTMSEIVVKTTPDLEAEANALSWLFAMELPSKDQLVLLVEEYFTNIHSLRSFGFIHKPSFMQQLDERGSSSNHADILLHVVCALGAKFHALKYAQQPWMAGDFVLQAGTQWAKKAHQLLFMDLNNISVENTMAVVLLHEHDLRIGKYASAFMLTGLGVRMAQALQINLESSLDLLDQGADGLAPSARESRRRLMWSIYIMDAWVGSGVDELTLVNERDIKIQLPCNEQNFVFDVPCIVETLEPGTFLPFVSPNAKLKGPAEALDLIAHFVRLVSIRRKILRYVKHLDTAQPPWLPSSEFAVLESSLRAWHDHLPHSLRYSRTSVYMRKSLPQFGGLLLLHLTYHQTQCDLHRIGLPSLFPQMGAHFSAQQAGFAEQVADRCFEHAVALSSVFEESARHGDADTLADTWLSVVAHDSAKVIAHYVADDLGSVEKDEAFKKQATTCLHANVGALRRMIPLHALARPLYIAAIKMLQRHNFDLPPSADLSPISDAAHTIVPDISSGSISELPWPQQFTPEYVLNPLAIFSMARSDIEASEKHAPERAATDAGASPGRTTGSPPSTADHIHMSASPEPALLYPDPPDAHTQPQQQQGADVGGSLQPMLDAMAAAGGPGGVDEFALPTSFDDLQAYLPLLGNLGMPGVQSGGWGGMASASGGGADLGFGDPATAAAVAFGYVNVTQPPGADAFPASTQPPWPS